MENVNISRDDFEKVFQDNEKFLEFLAERDSAAKWIDNVPISAITFKPILPIETLALSGAMGVSLEAAVDTASEGSGMLMELPDGTKYLLRENAWRQAKQRIIGGETGFSRLPIEKQMEVLRIYQDYPPKHSEALIRFSEEKASAFLASGLYAIVPAVDVFKSVKSLVDSKLGGAEFTWGIYSHTEMYCEYSFEDTNPKLRKSIDRYRDITGKDDLNLIMRVATSDTGNCAVSLTPWLVGSDNTHIPLGSALQFAHKGEKKIEDLEENIDMFIQGVERGASRMEEMKNIQIENPASTMIHAMKRVQLPAKYGMEVVTKFDTICGDNGCTALDIFMESNEVPVQIRLKEQDNGKAIRAEEACARMLGIHNWDLLDYPGALVWSGKEN